MKNLQKINSSNFTYINNTVTWDLVYFTTRVSDTCDTCAKRVTQVQHERSTSGISMTRVRHECYTNDPSTTRVWHEWKILILITRRMKTYFHIPILAVWLMKDYKERNNFILRTTFWICIVPTLKCILKVHHKAWTLQSQKLYQKVIH